MTTEQSTTVALGVFDGVHAGHRALIAAARDHADLMSTPLVAMTFWPHPRSVVRDVAVPLLATREDRVRLLEEAGADRVEVIDFTEEFSRITPEEFMQGLLVEQLGARAVAVGDNFRFGRRAAGTPEDLMNFAAGSGEHAFATLVSDVAEGDGAAISSTRIRGLLGDDGDVAAAARLLGREHSLPGVVVHGEKRGRELGYPTANLDHPAELVVPLDGVYAGWADVFGDRYLAAISVGTNPHFTEGSTEPKRTVEAYLLDYRGELDSLYDVEMRVHFAERLRGQERYDSLESLIAAIAGDVADVRRLLRS